MGVVIAEPDVELGLGFIGATTITARSSGCRWVLWEGKGR
jgi:hypothetical protein